MDMALPLGGLVVILPKNAPSTEIGERLAADRLSVMGCRSSSENPLSRNPLKGPQIQLGTGVNNCRHICAGIRGVFSTAFEIIVWVSQGNRDVYARVCS